MMKLLAMLRFDKWMSAFLRHPWMVLSFFSLTTIFFALQLPGLRFQSSIADLAIENHPETITYENFKKEFGTEEIILVKVKTAAVFDPAIFSQIEHLSQILSEIKGIERVISLPVIKRDIDPTGKMDLAQFERVIAPIDLLRKNLVSEDKKTTIIILVLSESREGKVLIDQVEEVLKSQKQGLDLYQIGLPNVSQILAEYTQRDFLRLPPVTFVVIGLVLIFFFRNFYGVILPLGCLVIALVWTFGLISWTGTPLAMVTMIVPVFLMAVGTAYCIHILSEYMKIAVSAGNQEEAVFETYGRVGTPSFLAVMTTLIGLGSLYANRMAAVRDFALFSCFGMIVILVLLFSLMPALLRLVPLQRIMAKPAKDPLGGLLQKLIDLHLGHRRPALFMMLLLAVAGLLGMFYLKVETNPVGYFKENTSVYLRFHDIYKGMAGSFPVNVVMDGMAPDYFEDLSHLRKILEAQEFLETLGGVDKAISFADYMKLVNYAVSRYQPDFYTLPKEPFEIRMLMNSFKTMLGQDMFNRFMNQDLSKSNIVLRTHISSSRDFLELREKIRAHFHDNASFRGLQVEVTGLGLVIAESSHILTIGQIKSLSITLALIFGVILLLFMSLRVGFIALLPNFLPIILLFGITGWAGFRLSVTTTLIASIAIGLAVDDTIHYLFRYRLEFKRDHDRAAALGKTLMSVGRPMIMTTVTLCAGFSVLVISSFKPTSEFGILMIITLFTALLGDIMILPSLMLKVNLVTIWDLLKLVTIQDKVSDAVAHQLTQPLNTIKMGSDFIQMMVERRENIPDKTLSEIALQISEQADRASMIINSLREFGRRAEAATAANSVNEAVRDVLVLMEQQFKLQNTEVIFDLTEPLPPVKANGNRLKPVIYNILTNAREAMEEKKETPSASQPNILKIKSFQHGSRIGLSISDTGQGMSRQEKERAFEPFFTTKEKGEGRGLGLAIALGIMRDYRGRIQLESQKWKGTTVTLEFPMES